MNIRDIRYTILLNAEPKDVLQLCRTDQLSNNICMNNEFQNEYMKNNNIKTNIKDFEQFKLVLLTLIKTEEAIEMLDNVGKYKVSFYNNDTKITFVIYKKRGQYYRSIEKKLDGRSSYEIDEIHENINKFVFSLIYASLK